MTHTQTQGADGAGTKTARFKPGDLVLNARYAHRDAYPALGENAYVQAVDGDYLDFGQGSKLLYSLFDPVIPALASPRADSAARTVGTDLDDRLRAAGMFTIPEMMGETPLTRWQTHAAMTSLDAFEWWLDAQVRQYLTMKAEYEIGDKPKDDELYEWVLAHSGAFHVIRTNFRAAKAATPAPATPPGVPDGLRENIVGLCNSVLGQAYLGKDPESDLAQKVKTLISAQPAGQSEQPILRVTVDVFADRTDTRLTFGDRIRPEQGVKAVEQAIAALTAEYEARGGCPVVGRQPAGQAGDAGGRGAVKQFARAILHGDDEHRAWITEAAECFVAGSPLPEPRGKGTQQPAPNSTRTGAAETVAVPVEPTPEMLAAGAPFTDEFHSVAADAYRAMIAARPEAPSDAGCAEIEDRLSEILTASQRQDLSDRLLSAYMAPHGGLRLDNAEVAYLWTRLGGSLDLPTPPSDPAPSGQAEG